MPKRGRTFTISPSPRSPSKSNVKIICPGPVLEPFHPWTTGPWFSNPPLLKSTFWLTIATSMPFGPEGPKRLYRLCPVPSSTNKNASSVSKVSAPKYISPTVPIAKGPIDSPVADTADTSSLKNHSLEISVSVVAPKPTRREPV